MREEFDELYPALFKKSERYIAVVRFLAGNRQGLFMSENNLMHGTVFTFVTPYGVAKGKYSGMLHSELTLKDLFRPNA